MSRVRGDDGEGLDPGLSPQMRPKTDPVTGPATGHATDHATDPRKHENGEIDHPMMFAGGKAKQQHQQSGDTDWITQGDAPILGGDANRDMGAGNPTIWGEAKNAGSASAATSDPSLDSASGSASASAAALDLGLVTASDVNADALYLDLEGWEGPLDLLLDLARRQKVDLLAISILELVDQYLHYIDRAESLRLELAADYLVMAAWLAYLKSSMLLPKEEQEEPAPEELALRLQLRLQRLAAMRESAARLMARDRIGRDVFLRGNPEGLQEETRAQWQCDWFDLVQSYARVKARHGPAVHQVQTRAVMTLEQALERVSHMLGMSLDWIELNDFLPQQSCGDMRRSALASSFLAALELARSGRAEMQQDACFGALRLRRISA